MTEVKPGAPDPSMEDILASIRKILNEDEQGGEAAEAGGAVQLTTDMMIAPPEPARVASSVEVPVSTPQPEPARAVEPGAAVAESPPPVVEAPSRAPEPAPVSTAAPEPAPALVPAGAPVAAEVGLVAPAAAAAAAAALGELSRAVAQDRGAVVSRSGLTIEDVVREALRPLLKEWLDTHLPGITERLVRAEIERVMSRQG